MSGCQIPNGCMRDDQAHACPLCDEHGADDIAAFYASVPESNVVYGVDFKAKPVLPDTACSEINPDSGDCA